MKSLISVIVPVFNASDWIDRCLDSIVAQSHSCTEILLIVGNCQDDSLEKCIKYQNKDSRIIVMSRNDFGQGDARNYGIKISKGKYIAFVDADDCIEPNYLSNLVTPLEEDDKVDVSCCGFDGIEDGGAWLPLKMGKVQVSFNYIATKTWPTVWIYLYRRAWLLEHNMWMFPGCHEDDAWRLLLAAELKYVYFVQKALYHYNSFNVNSTMHVSSKRRSIIPAMEYAMNALTVSNKFEKYRCELRKYFADTWRIQYIFSEFDELMVKEEESFYKKFFPEVLLERELVQQRTLDLNNNLIMFGAGDDAHMLLSKHYKPEPKYIIDNDRNKHDTLVEGSLVKAYENIFNEKEPFNVIVSSSKFYYELTSILRNDNITNILPVEEYPLIYQFWGKKRNKRIILFYLCESNDVGECIIAESERMFISNYFYDYDLVEITDDMFRRNGRWLNKYIKDTDLIFFNAGNRLGSLNLKGGEIAFRTLLKNFSHNKIVVLPQNMYYSNDTFGKAAYNEMLSLLKKVDDLVLCLNNNTIYSDLKKQKIKGIRYIFMPDLSMAMKEYYAKKERTNSIGLCLVKGNNSSLSVKDKERISVLLCDLGKNVVKIHMTNDNLYKRMIRRDEQEQAVRYKIEEISDYEVVITDDYYCVIMCAISETPCVILKTVSGNTSGLYSWLVNHKYIALANNIDEIQEKVLRVMNVKEEERKYKFKCDGFLNKLKEIIVGD